MPHVFCHDITAYCGSRTKHDQNGNQLVMGKSKSDSNWKKNGAKADQLHKSPRGVAVFPRLLTVLERIVGRGRRRTDQIRPARIPRIIGLLAIPFKVFRSICLFIP